MNEPTVCNASHPFFPADLSEAVGGCVVRIYPTTGPAGLWELNLDELKLGRSPECEIELPDDAVSRRHAAIQRVGHEFFLVDLHSTNGTFINDRRVTHHRLQAGDRIHVGGHILKFLSHDEIERQYHETVYAMTTTDGLTGAYNKQYLREALQREIARASRHRRPLSLLMMDLDFFKRINDTHGHLAGDEVLKTFANRVRDVIEKDDLFARFGGEEFAVLLSERDSDAVTAIAERIRAKCSERPMLTIAGSITATVSIGVVTYNGAGSPSPDQMLHSADQLLYLAKQRGRDRVLADFYLEDDPDFHSNQLTVTRESLGLPYSTPDSGTRH